jgi:dienelactone hydrolase
MRALYRLGVAVLALAAYVAAANAAPPAGFGTLATQAPDLVFPEGPSPLPSGAPFMAIYKPDGAGPFPALILHHQCGGLRSNPSMLDWTTEALRRGYVVLMLDSFAQRGVDSVCMSPKNGVYYARGMRDAIQAARHLRKFDFVDKRRIAHAGFSWGAMAGLLAGSRSSASTAGGSGIAAFVSIYPACWTANQAPSLSAPHEIVNADINRPTLVLLGGKDTETPPSDCLPRLKAAKAAGAPIAWHLYPNAGHCWDCWQWDGTSRIDFKGDRMEYRFDKAVTQDSMNRTFRFLDRALGR